MGRFRRRAALFAAGCMGLTMWNSTYRIPPPLSTADIHNAVDATETLRTGVDNANRNFAVSSPVAKSSSAEAIEQKIYDIGIIGGGIIGLTVANELQKQYPDKTIVLLEKESAVAQHQTSHNSGVIHGGIYYEPGSRMARLCVRGVELMYSYCEKHGLPVDRCGKLIVATGIRDQQVVRKLYERGVKNGVQGLEVLPDAASIAAKEPCVKGLNALWAPNTGVCDFAAVARHVANDLQQRSDKFSLLLNFEVRDMTTAVLGSSGSSSNPAKEVVAIRGLEPSQSAPYKTVLARNVINCAGLGMDTVAASAGGEWSPNSVSFRGRYYQLTEAGKKKGLIRRSNVYPCPPQGGGIPVGIHFTPTVGETHGEGNIIVGPGSAICGAREGYSPYDIDFAYLGRVLTSFNFWRFALNYPGLAMDQLYTDLSFARFLQDAKQLIPKLEAEDLEPSFCGVMTQVFTQEGEPEKDFVFEESRPAEPVQLTTLEHLQYTITGKRPAAPQSLQSGVPDGVNASGRAATFRPLVLNIRNAPSPAATASFAIAEDITERAAGTFKWPTPTFSADGTAPSIVKENTVAKAVVKEVPPPGTLAEEPEDAADVIVHNREHIPIPTPAVVEEEPSGQLPVGTSAVPSPDEEKATE